MQQIQVKKSALFKSYYNQPSTQQINQKLSEKKYTQKKNQ